MQMRHHFYCLKAHTLCEIKLEMEFLVENKCKKSWYNITLDKDEEGSFPETRRTTEMSKSTMSRESNSSSQNRMNIPVKETGDIQNKEHVVWMTENKELKSRVHVRVERMVVIATKQ